MIYSEYITQNDSKAISANTTESQMLIQLSLYGRRRAKRRDTMAQDTDCLYPKYTALIYFVKQVANNGKIRNMRYNPAK